MFTVTKPTLLLKTPLLLIALLIACNVSAQNINGAINLGTNLSQVDGDEVYGFHKYGLSVGPSVVVPMDKFSFSLSMLYNQKGAWQKATRPTEQNKYNGQYELKLTYIDIPILVHFTDNNIITIGAGISWGRLVNANEWEHGFKTNTSTRNSVYTKNDWEALVDLRFKILKKLPNLLCNFKYAYSINKIRTRTFLNGETRKQFNNVISINAIWIFNSKPTE